MRRIALALAAGGLAAAALVTPAQADEHLPEHPHLLLLGADFSDAGVTFRKCVDLAGGQALPLHVHHEHLHVGKTGQALREHAGHLVIPAAPFPSPFITWRDCQEFERLFGSG